MYLAGAAEETRVPATSFQYLRLEYSQSKKASQGTNCPTSLPAPSPYCVSHYLFIIPVISLVDGPQPSETIMSVISVLSKAVPALLLTLTPWQ